MSRDDAAQAKRQAKKRAAGIALAKRLDEAVNATNAYLHACGDCQDGSGLKGPDDGRLLMIETMKEYSMYLDGLYNK